MQSRILGLLTLLSLGSARLVPLNAKEFILHYRSGIPYRVMRAHRACGAAQLPSFGTGSIDSTAHKVVRMRSDPQEELL